MLTRGENGHGEGNRVSAYVYQVTQEQDPLSWPTVKLVLGRLKDENDKKVYQGAVLTNYNSAMLKTCVNSALADVKRLESEMKAG